MRICLRSEGQTFSNWSAILTLLEEKRVNADVIVTIFNIIFLTYSEKGRLSELVRNLHLPKNNTGSYQPVE